MRVFLFLTIAIAIGACSGKSSGKKAFDNALATYTANPGDSTASAVYTTAQEFIADKGFSDPATPDVLLGAANIAAERNDFERALGFYRAYLVEYPNRPDVADRIHEVILMAETRNQPELNQVLYKLFSQRFPKDARAKAFAEKIEDNTISADSIMHYVASTVFNDSIFRYDVDRGHLYITLCQAAVMINPALSDAPKYLFRAAETVHTLRDFRKAIDFYDWIISKYPADDLSATALFVKSFSLENDFQDLEGARKGYHEYLRLFPNGQYAESARFLLEHLGKSEDELKKIIEAGEKNRTEGE